MSSYYEKFLATGEVKCIDEEINTAIPEGWSFARFGTVVYNRDSERIPLSVSERSRLKKTYDYYGASGVIDKVDKYLFDKDLLLIGEDGANLINRSTPIAFIATGKYWVNNHAHVLDCIDNVFMRYICLYINSISLVEYVTGTAQPKMNQEKMNSIMVLVPPYKEQIRILEKVEEVLPTIMRYGASQCRLNVLNKELYANLRKSLLQEAIQGKLVPQDPSDEPASMLLQRIRDEKQRLVKEGKLKQKDVVDSTIFRGDDNKYYENDGKNVVCIDDEIPFEIPSSWQWVRLEHICSYIQRGKSPKYSPIKQYPVVAQKCNQWTGFTIEKAQFIDPTTIESYTQERFLEDGDLMWNSTGLGTLGRMAIYWEKLNPFKVAVADSHVTVIRPLKSCVIPQYLYNYFSSYTVQSVIEDKADGSTKQKELATNTVKRYLVPFPPLAEQMRIVEKIKEVTSIMRG